MVQLSVNVSVGGFWKDQLLLCFPALWVWLPGLLALLLYPPFRPYRGLGIIYLVGLLILTVLHGKSYYTLGYYLVLSAWGLAYCKPLTTKKTMFLNVCSATRNQQPETSN